MTDHLSLAKAWLTKGVAFTQKLAISARFDSSKGRGTLSYNVRRSLMTGSLETRIFRASMLLSYIVVLYNAVHCRVQCFQCFYVVNFCTFFATAWCCFNFHITPRPSFFPPENIVSHIARFLIFSTCFRKIFTISRRHLTIFNSAIAA